MNLVEYNKDPWNLPFVPVQETYRDYKYEIIRSQMGTLIGKIGIPFLAAEYFNSWTFDSYMERLLERIPSERQIKSVYSLRDYNDEDSVAGALNRVADGTKYHWIYFSCDTPGDFHPLFHEAGKTTAVYRTKYYVENQIKKIIDYLAGEHNQYEMHGREDY